jgi:hypothetical protein
MQKTAGRIDTKDAGVAGHRCDRISVPIKPNSRLRIIPQTDKFDPV